MNIKNDGIYKVEHLSEGKYEHGLYERVLKNLQEIKGKREIDLLEASLLKKTLKDYE